MALIVKTIGTGVRDFSTIAGWVASLPANLVTDGNSQEGDCYNDSEFTTTSAVAISGHTTDSTHTITLTTGAGQSFRDNANVRTNPLTYDATKGVGVRSTASYINGTISGTDNNVTISNLQVWSNGTGNSDKPITFSSSQSGIVIQDCILVGGTGTTQQVVLLFANNHVDDIIIRNCLVIVESASCQGMKINQGCSAYFCTIVSPTGVASTLAAIDAKYTNNVAKNCAIYGFTGAFVSSGITYTTCATDQASPPTGVTQITTYANQFVSVADASKDFRLKAGSGLQGAGTSDSTNGATDISGLARPQGGNWDIGAWELAAAASGLGARLSDRANVLIGGGLVLA